MLGTLEDLCFQGLAKGLQFSLGVGELKVLDART